MTASPAPPDPRCATPLREALDALNFQTDAIAARLGGRPSMTPRDRPRLRYATREESALDVAIRLFMLQERVSLAAVGRAFPSGQIARFEAAGLWDVQPTEVSARFAISCVYGLRILHDRTAPGSPPPDFVVGIGRASQLGIRATPRTAVGSALEIGTGCGGAALLLARHAQRVVATDVNPRALAITAFNAALNGVRGIEVRAGSLFEPASGERFDLIVSNPPFVVAPEREFVFRDSGFGGDAFVERLVREAPRYLRPEGHCVAVANWIEVQGTPWREKLAGWVERGDALFARMDRFAPDDYAAVWLAETLPPESVEFDEGWRRWRDYLAELRVEAVGGGLIALRNSGGAARAWFLDGVSELDDEAGNTLVELLAARADLTAREDLALLDARPRIRAGVSVEETLESRGEGWETKSALLRLQHGLHSWVAVEPGVANLIGRCNGARSVREIADALAREHQFPPDEFAPVAAQMVRSLIERGALSLGK